MTDICDMFTKSPLRLASRASNLALVQTSLVRDALSRIDSTVVPITTSGDRITDRSLADAGGKGLFIKELESAVQEGRCDAAVHSMKDMPPQVAPGTSIAAILPRGDRRDAMVGAFESIDALPADAVVGTASVRRRAILLNRRPDLRVRLLRGNVGTRIAALERGEFDAIILAVAGLERLDVKVPWTALDTRVFPPAAAQGALAIQVRAGEDERIRAVAEACAALNDAASAREVTAERAFLARLDGTCHSPIAANATPLNSGTIRLEGMILNQDGSQAHEAALEGPNGDAEALGARLADMVLEQAGGRDFLGS